VDPVPQQRKLRIPAEIIMDTVVRDGKAGTADILIPKVRE
jgi:hypothetical protein